MISVKHKTISSVRIGKVLMLVGVISGVCFLQIQQLNIGGDGVDSIGLLPTFLMIFISFPLTVLGLLVALAGEALRHRNRN